ncbi:MAG: GAF domain-containing protein [Magnetococcales bacterium]|nr:GAF domain-containing protein [Magnetococcales bacterium]
MSNKPSKSHHKKITRLNAIGTALSKAADTATLLEQVLLGAKELTHADAATFYRVTPRFTLCFEIMVTSSLGIYANRSSGKSIDLPEIPLHVNGHPNFSNVAAYASLSGQTVKIADVSTAKDFNFSGTQLFDEKIGYRSISFLTVPLKNRDNDVIGVIQLINAIDQKSGAVVAFSLEDQHLVESLASQATLVLVNQLMLEHEQQRIAGVAADFLKKINALNTIAVIFAAEKDSSRLTDLILHHAMELTHADAGVVYSMTNLQTLCCEAVRINSLDVKTNETSGMTISLPELPLYQEGAANLTKAAVYAALKGEVVNMADLALVESFDCSDMREFDSKSGYHSISMLLLPLKNHDNELLGVLQLINATDSTSREIRSFSPEDEHLATSLTIQAATTLSNLKRFAKLNKIGVALSTEKNIDRLMELILLEAKELTHADAGTLYSATDRQTLRFEIIRTDSLGIKMGGTTGVPINFPELPLYNKDGQPNMQMVAAYAALSGKTVNIPDAYLADGFDFSGMRAFDAKTGYRSTSFLTVPLKDHENKLLGILQLINASDRITNVVRPFSQENQSIAESLASQAAIAMSNQKLIANLRQLFEAFIQSIASAVDEKSPYTGGHCYRVPVLAELLGQAAHESSYGVLKDFSLTDEEMYELKIAAWLHDCGKVTTPTEVVDKATKLEKIYDRVHVVDTRFEVLKRDAEIRLLQQKLAALEQGHTGHIPELEQQHQETVRQLVEDRDFIRTCNIGGEFMSDALKERVNRIAGYRWVAPDGEETDLLTENEVYNLHISRGTINKEERDIINNHVSATIKMLAALPFPQYLSRVSEIAGSHHEAVNGSGYPKKLTRDQMSVQARIMAIADVFEALTARDRPYKPGKTLSQSLKILGFMKKDQHIDPDLFQVFIDKKIYLQYAEQYLSPEQIDEVNPKEIPGYVSPE